MLASIQLVRGQHLTSAHFKQSIVTDSYKQVTLTLSAMGSWATTACTQAGAGAAEIEADME